MCELKNMNITALILTFNESQHIERCIKSLLPFCDRICVVDSFSTDDTVEKVKALGAEVFSNKWENNYAKQLNWGLQNCNISTDWTMRIDADEYILPELQQEITEKLGRIPENVSGIELKRRMIFKGKWVKRGGYYPIRLLRIFRTGMGICEERLMDEHIVLESGDVIQFDHDVVDENLNSIHWWVAKHNNYARREATDILNQKYDLVYSTDINSTSSVKQAVLKRKIKNNFYNNLPLGIRPILYFTIRMIPLLGILDGPKGWIFHFMQGLWYRMLVDINVMEMEELCKGDKALMTKIIKNDWKIEF